jgi:hypothetical protein
MLMHLDNISQQKNAIIQ